MKTLKCDRCRFYGKDGNVIETVDFVDGIAEYTGQEFVTRAVLYRGDESEEVVVVAVGFDQSAPCKVGQPILGN